MSISNVRTHVPLDDSTLPCSGPIQVVNSHADIHETAGGTNGPPRHHRHEQNVCHSKAHRIGRGREQHVYTGQTTLLRLGEETPFCRPVKLP